VLFKNGDDLFAGRHGLLQKDATLGLVDDHSSQADVVLQLDRDHEIAPGSSHVLGHGDRIAGDFQQLAVKLFALLAALRVQDAKGPALGLPGVVDDLGVDFVPDTRHQPRQHAHTVEQQGAVARFVDVRGNHGAVDPHDAALFNLCDSGFFQNQAIDQLQSLGLDAFDVFLQG
jgi:hypothetical protein